MRRARRGRGCRGCRCGALQPAVWASRGTTLVPVGRPGGRGCEPWRVRVALLRGSVSPVCARTHRRCGHGLCRQDRNVTVRSLTCSLRHLGCIVFAQLRFHKGGMWIPWVLTSGFRVFPKVLQELILDSAVRCPGQAGPGHAAQMRAPWAHRVRGRQRSSACALLRLNSTERD